MTINTKCTILVDTLRIEGSIVNSIYYLDILVSQAKETGNMFVTIKDPGEAILSQINELRPNYALVFKVA